MCYRVYQHYVIANSIYLQVEINTLFYVVCTHLLRESYKTYTQMLILKLEGVTQNNSQNTLIEQSS